MPFKPQFALLLCTLLSSAIGFAARASAQAPAIKSVYLTTISGSKYLTAEFRPATRTTISYQVSANLSIWSSPGINGYPNVVQTVSPTDSQVLVARLDTPLSAQSRYFFRVLAQSVPFTRHPPLDFDGDGFTDWAVLHYGTGAGRPVTWNIAYHRGGTRSVVFGSGNTDYPVPADYDGDGICDIAVWTDAAPSQYKILQSSTGTTKVVNFGQPGDEPTVGDFDGDGKADPAVFRRGPGSSEAHLFYLGSFNNPDGLVTEVPMGTLGITSSDYLAPGDYDGDGKNDLCVQTPASSTDATGVFLLKRSSDGVEERIPFGLFNDLVVEGDYDGDGRSDFALIREVSGQLQWSILQRNGGGTGNTPYILGTSADFGVPGDYDGDGKQDIAVWHDSTGVFTVRRSSDGNLMTFTLGVSGDYPLAAYQVH